MASGSGGFPGPALPSVRSPLCKAATEAYVSAMAIFPRPVTPKSAITDLREMFSPDRPHRWSILALSVTLTGLVLWGFALDTRAPKKEREIYYVESWMADRKDSDIIRQQMKDLDKYEAALNKKQDEFQRLADGLGIEWREEEARNTAQRKAVMVAIHKRLDERLAKAEVKETARPNSVATAP